MRRSLVRVLVVTLPMFSQAVLSAGSPPIEWEQKVLEFREIKGDSVAQSGEAIPAAAVQVFVHAGEPRSARITEKYIAADYRRSGVLFDRTTGKKVKQWTVADRWPDVRPSLFDGGWVRSPEKQLLGPGVLRLPYRLRTGEMCKPEVAVSVVFEGRAWRAFQTPQALEKLLDPTRGPDRHARRASWTSILSRLNEESYLEVVGREGEQPRRYTMADGLASNIVTRLAVAEGALWAACADIYDHDKKQWGPGGLCRFNPGNDRWERLHEIDGRPVRWVTLLEVVGDEIWVGFREGEGVAGDLVHYGMARSIGRYRPMATSLVLARRSQGDWSTFSRPLLPDLLWSGRSYKEPPPPSEAPQKLAKIGDQIILYSGPRGNRRGQLYDYQLDGQVSLLDSTTGHWRIFDTVVELGAVYLVDMIAEQGEILVVSNVGLHRWDTKAETWRLLDPGGVIQNPSMETVVAVGNELWVGYRKHSWGLVGKQGISRYHEETGNWSHMSPAELGTSAPVESIAVLSNGEVWVLFGGVRFSTSDEFFPFDWLDKKVGRQGGVGRLAAGKWGFPVRPEGIPKDPNPRSYIGMVGIRDRLFLAISQSYDPASKESGVYAGPGEWHRIVSGPVAYLEPSGDESSLITIRWVPDRKLQLGRYDVATGGLTWETLEGELMSRWREIIHAHRYRRFGRSAKHGPWVIVPTTKDGKWAVGPLTVDSHKVVLTPYALWIASRGELIRLDRKRLAEWLGV